MNDLVTQGYVKQLYQCPFGGAYEWSVNNGNQAYHLKCDAQHTPSSNHVCIHEDQPARGQVSGFTLSLRSGRSVTFL